MYYTYISVCPHVLLPTYKETSWKKNFSQEGFESLEQATEKFNENGYVLLNV